MPLNRKQIRTRRTILLSLALLATALVALFFGAKWLTVERFAVTTDNAFVNGNLIPVYSDATGVVTDVVVEETQSVKKGDLLVRLDGQRAGAAILQAEGELSRAVRTVGALYVQRRQSCDKIASRIALRDRARHDVARYQAATPSGSVSQQTLQNARDQLAALEADVREARADRQSIEARVGGVTRLTHPDIQAAKAKYVDAAIELARQNIKAPVAGYVAKRKAQVGDRVRPGDQILTIVPLDHLWVEANLWENRMERVRPGQSAEIIADLYGKNVLFHGKVEGLAPGSGSVFALLPPDNATGNFIHIVQRVPVRITLQADELARYPLRPGLSTVTTIDVSKTDVPVNDSQTKTAAPEYSTDIYGGELAQANAKADEIVRANLVGAGDATEPPCAIGE